MAAHRAFRGALTTRSAFCRVSVLVCATMVLSGCNLFTSTPAPGSDPMPPDAGADVRHIDSSTDDAEVPDAKVDPDARCTAETDDEFCARQAAECGVLSAEDNCGELRSARCGTCPAGETCGLQEPAKCACLPESGTDFCARLGKDCGMGTEGKGNQVKPQAVGF